MCRTFDNRIPTLDQHHLKQIVDCRIERLTDALEIAILQFLSIFRLRKTLLGLFLDKADIVT